ncbi:hypothetical protein NSTC745_01481 [Nostoc sp. DSM 114161]|jgi:hypothetical protein|uniref:hypothetical protein n=1 Tax=Nostoc sp. DSM 114161 TaxID=3440143 RepID=UPI00404594F5
MSDTIPVYQFSRNFDNPHPSAQHNNRWVSGGNIIDPEKKIALWNQEVPQEIRKAVLDGYFAINDSYPPAENDFALIAREIDDKYAVLAVANGQIDDRDRPTIGYKYFWLEKTDSYIDGIGTLIYWWQNVNYQFDMQELNSTSKPEIYYAQIWNKINFAEPWLEKKIKETVNNFKHIPCTGVVTKEYWGDYPPYIRLHYLSLGLSFRSDSLNAWAWNVQKLSFAENFVYILYSTSADIPPNLYKQLVPDKIIITINDLQSDNSEKNSESTSQNQDTPPDDAENKNSAQTENSDTSNDSESDNSESTNQNENTPPHGTENQNRVQPPVQKIKTCLTELARTFHSRNQLDVKKAEELFGYLTNYSNANWSDFIDQTTLNTTANPISEIYKAEIYLIVIAYDQKQKWLIDLLKSIHVENKPSSIWDFLTFPFKILLNPPINNDHIFPLLEFQDRLLKESCKYDSQVQQRLTESIYYGITFFLTILITFDPNDPKHQRLAQQINYLLIESQSIWSQYFQKYAEIVADRFFYQPEIDVNAYKSVRKFCQTILEKLEEIKNNNCDSASRKRLYGEYKSLAPIFAKINRRDLAELFYLISGSQVPQEVIGNIPEEFRTTIFTRNYVLAPVSPGNPQLNKNIIITIVTLLFGIPIIYFIFYEQITNSIGSPQVSCEQENWLVDYSTFESCYRNANEYQKNIIIGKFMPDQTDITDENKLKQKGKAIQFIDETPKGDETEFQRRIEKLQECQKVNATQFGKCLENKEQTAVNNTGQDTNQSNETPNTIEPPNKIKCSLQSYEQVKNCNSEEFNKAIEQVTKFNNIEKEYIELLRQYLQKQDKYQNFNAKKEKSIECFQTFPVQKVVEFNDCLNPLKKESADKFNKFISSQIPDEIIKYLSPAKPNRNHQKKSK